MAYLSGTHSQGNIDSNKNMYDPHKYDWMIKDIDISRNFFLAAEFLDSYRTTLMYFTHAVKDGERPINSTIFEPQRDNIYKYLYSKEDAIYLKNLVWRLVPKRPIDENLPHSSESILADQRSLYRRTKAYSVMDVYKILSVRKKTVMIGHGILKSSDGSYIL
ncbi:unknown [Lactobacillus phage Lb338-1]|uniref:Uncharacterized protein n=1 Tax=Lactobacillus phage Lb338-1 TaxID=2892342 RepID=C1KFG7_9CAUD|nr:hypothetical protein lb338_phage_57 [Lactobacillus phage Lb338-1]ACO36978.1 unknown [Lactobacillus phage Lb338-1]